MNTKKIQELVGDCNALKSFADAYEGYRDVQLEIGNGAVSRQLSITTTDSVKANILRTVNEEIRRIEALIKTEIGG